MYKQQGIRKNVGLSTIKQYFVVCAFWDVECAQMTIWEKKCDKVWIEMIHETGVLECA